MNDAVKVYGSYLIEEVDRNGQLLSRTRQKNLITDAFFAGVFKFLNQPSDAPNVFDLAVSHIAVGVGSTIPGSSDTVLANELFRKAVTSTSKGVRHFQAVVVLTPSEGNGALREIGVFAHGSGAAGSGTLLSRALIDKVKNTNITLNLYWKLTIE